MDIRLISCLILIDIIITPLTSAVDPLQCSCDCGVENNGGDITTLTSYISQVRGEKGDRGINGQRGPRGLRGSVGKQGQLGVRGARGKPGIPAPGSPVSGSAKVPLSSCAHLQRAGHTENGVYKTRSLNTSSTNHVYCDMEVDGGGWTLVASVHENNIDGKCSTGDNWSDNSKGKSSDTNSWSNTRIFGSVDGATGSDYKSSDYFNLPASDVMVWHVPNNLPPSQWSQQASLKYYTNNNFLTQYGGNLRDLYTNYYPMERQKKTTKGFQVEGIVNMIIESSDEILNEIPGFYKYQYDGELNVLRNGQISIKIGSKKMFDDSQGGNKVYVRAGDEDWHSVIYGDTFTDHPAYDVTNTANAHPFIALMYIGNDEGTEETFDLKVETLIDGRTGSKYHPSSTYKGEHDDGDGEFTFGDFTVKFKKYDAHGAYEQRCTYDGHWRTCWGDKSYYSTICEVYFVVYSSERWNSAVSNQTSFFHPIKWGGSQELKNTVRVEGSPQNVLLGYTLLSKEEGEETEMSDIENALKIMVEKITQFNPKEGLEAIRSNLHDTGSNITDVLPNFNFYEYDGNFEPVEWNDKLSAIKTGGNQMFQTVEDYRTGKHLSSGNKVYVRSSSTDWHQVIYGRTFTEENKYQISSNIHSHPFTTLMSIENSDGSDESFHVKVESLVGGQWKATRSTFEGKLKLGDFTMEYKTSNVYEMFDRSTVCEVYFVVYNYKTWYSVYSENSFGPDWNRKAPWILENGLTSNSVYVNGHPRNMLLGYTLFSREKGNPMHRPYVREAMIVMLKKIFQFSTTNEVDCSRLDESIVVPIHFHTGSTEDVSSSIPPTQRLGTTSGYLQLRAVSPQGLPYAMCPAVKTGSCRPSSLCIGGINTLKDDPSSCGDFAGYGGIREDNPTATDADGSARSLNDLKSSILIFTRDSTSTSSKVF